MKRRVQLAALAALLAGAVFGCLDAIAPGHGGARGGSFALLPVFEGATSGGIPGDVDLIRLTLHDPPSPDTTMNFPVTPGQEEISITVPVALNATVDSVVISFQAIRSSDNTVLYSGTDTVAVAAGLPTSAAPIVAAYVGPGKNILSISITPPAVTLPPGDTLTFGFTALDSSEATIVGMPALFASKNPSVATVSNTGLARAVNTGSTYVVVTSGARSSIKDSALVTVAATAPALIALAPSSVNIVDTAGTSDPAPRTVNVTNSGGGTLSGLAVGTITYGASQPTGWLTATLTGTTAPTTLSLQVAKGSLAAGTYTATVPVQSTSASNSPQSVSVTFQIVPAPIPLASLTATPGYRVTLPGDTVTVQVAGKDSLGGTVSTPGLTFLSRTSGVATVNAASGFVTAVGAGSAVIVAQAPGASGTVSDSILVVVPATGSAAVLTVGDGRAFDQRRVGDTVRVQVLVDLRAISTEVLGSYDAQLNWTAAALSYVRSDTVSGGFAAPTINEAQTSTGQLRFGSADPNGSAGPVALIQITFVATATGTSSLQLTLTDLSAAKTFTNLLPSAAIVSGNVTNR